MSKIYILDELGIIRSTEEHFLKKPYRSNINEALSLRIKKNILFEERSEEFIFFPKREAEQK